MKGNFPVNEYGFKDQNPEYFELDHDHKLNVYTIPDCACMANVWHSTGTYRIDACLVRNSREKISFLTHVFVYFPIWTLLETFGQG